MLKRIIILLPGRSFSEDRIMSGMSCYEKNLCMKTLMSQHSAFELSHFCDASAGKIHSSFIYIVKGSVSINAVRRRFRFDSGTLYYVPEGIRYMAAWDGKPEIEYYSLHIVSNHSYTASENFMFQRLSELESPETLSLFREIFTLMESGDRVKRIKAISLYYSFYAQAFPLLRPCELPKYNPAVIKAMEYIKANYTEDFPISDLGSTCGISESRLYHLFCSDLDSTPVSYRNEIRIEKAALLLHGSEMSVEDVGMAVGFNSTVYFRKVFKKETGLNPGQYRDMIR